MLASTRIVLLACLVLMPALAVASTSETDARKQVAAKALAAAIAACDEGAAMPLDPTAKAPPVQFMELMPYDFDMPKLEALQRACQQAWAGAPQERRLQLQWLRVTMTLNKPGQEWLVIPQVQMLANHGSAEADFLLFRLYADHARNNKDDTDFAISKEDALAALRRAGEQGHLNALMELMWLYRNGRFVKLDLKQAVVYGRRAESAPPQGIAETENERDNRAYVTRTIALMTLEGEGFAPQEQRIAFRTIEDVSKAGSVEDATLALPYIKAVRAGIGTRADPVRARQLLEARLARDQYAIPVLADMLVKGEGGPADPKRALALLREERARGLSDGSALLADMLLDGKVVGAQPQEAIRVLGRQRDVNNYIRLAGMLIDYQPRLEDAETIVSLLADAAAAGDARAAIALARLKLSDNSQFRDIDGARALLKPLADAGDRTALWLYASSQYANLDSSSSQPYRLDGGFSDEELKRLIAEGLARKEPQAFLLKARLLRKGVLYSQDDQAATTMLINAANLGNVEAMLLLGDAYDDGLGTPKNPRERLHAWREAAKRGSLAAKKKLADAFTFDTFDKLMTLDEGVTGRLVLYINGVGRMMDGMGIGGDAMAEMEFGSLFSFGSRAMEAGAPAVADAVMNAFRQAPAGLDEKTLVALGKAFPDEIRVAIEGKLKSDGFYSGQPNGYFGPDVRQALAAWVDAKGPLADTPAADAKQDLPPKAKDEVQVAPDMLARVRDRAFKDGMDAKTDRQKLTAISALNVLAQYGDSASRWALVRNYHQARVVRKIVSVAEVTRYALDITVSKPEGVDKAEFEFIFDITQIEQDGQIGAFGNAVLSAVRDDVRLQDPLTLGGILKQFIFAPGACDAVLDAANKARVKDLGQDGCDDDTMSALVAFGKARGPAGIDVAARKAAVTEIMALDALAEK